MNRRNEGTVIYWLVWCEGGGAPTAKHQSPAAAGVEARRLAIANPGKRFVVLRSECDYFVPEPRPIVTEHTDDIPF